jgi:hypothetical protein
VALTRFGPTGGAGGFCYYKAHDIEVPNKAGSTALVPGKPPPPPPPPPTPVVPTGVKAAWFFPRGSAPADLQPDSKDAPDPLWGKTAPDARFYTTPDCPSQHFIEEQMIFDLTLCGQWAGAVFKEQCPGLGDCASYVRANASAFDEAYWLVDSLRVYSKTTAGR